MAPCCATPPQRRPGRTSTPASRAGRCGRGFFPAATDSASGAPRVALTGAPLARRQLVAPACERIVFAAEVDAHRCPLEAERFAEGVHEVAAVVLGRALRLRTVDHDHRRIAPALVSVAQA